MEMSYKQFFKLHREYFLLIKDGNWVPRWLWNQAHRDFLRTDLWRQMRITRYNLSNKKCDSCNDFCPLDEGQLHHLTYKKPFGLEDIEKDLSWLCAKCHENQHSRGK